MKVLYVGDIHIKPSNLEESESLFQFVLDTATENKADRVVFTGDVNDTHDVVRLRVLEFLDKWFREFRKKDFKTVVIAGNHDMLGDYSNCYTSLNPFRGLEQGNFGIVEKPFIDGIFGYLPYIHDDKQFIEEANELAEQGATILVSHPNFVGAVYDNGTPINNGVDPSLLDQRFLHLIGGHIHTELRYDRVWYIGTPRWLTASCANKSKGIWLVTHADTGEITEITFLSTDKVCTPIRSFTWNQGEEKPEMPSGSKNTLELVGSSDWITEQKKELKGLASISSKITDVKKSQTRKSGKNLFEFLSSHYQTDSNKRQKLIDYLKGLELLG